MFGNDKSGKFEPLLGNDTMNRNGINTEIRTKFICITSMEQHSHECLEELRAADYAANRKGKSGGMTGGSLFGNTATASTGGGLFGSTTSNAFGQQSTGITGSSLFGNTTSNTNTGGGGLFCNTTAAKPSTGLFGSTTTTFGSPAQPAATGGSLFGNNTASTGGSLFGNTAAKPATGGLFGSTTSNTFGQQKPATGGSLFGNTTANTSTGGGLFGNTAAKPATGGLFGSNTTTSTFGQQQSQPATGGSLFGSNTASTGGSLFGNTAKPATGGSLFGAGTSTFGQQQQQQPATGSLFGNTSNINIGGGLFGNAAAVKPSTGLFGSNTATSTFGQQQQSTQQFSMAAPSAASVQPIYLGGKEDENAIQRAILESQLSTSPYGDIPIFKYRSASRIISSSSVLAMNNEISNVQSQLRQLANSYNTSLNGGNTSALNNLSNISALASLNTSFSYKPLVRLPSLGFDHGSRNQSTLNLSLRASPQKLAKNNSFMDDTKASNKSLKSFDVSVFKTSNDAKQAAAVSTLSTSKTNSTGMNSSTHSIFLNEGYYVEPPLEELERTFKDGKYYVHGGLIVGRNEYGSVFWPGDFELSTIDFESIISFRSKEVVVYRDDEKKPKLGIDLNRAAEVSLERVWPFDKDTKEYVRDPIALGKLQFHARLERACRRMDARFIDYQVTTGTWKFGVTHFSKYGLIDDEYDELLYTPEQSEAVQRQKEQMNKVQLLPLEKKKSNLMPLREIQVSVADYSFAASGLGGGGFVDPMIKYEGKNFGVTLTYDLDAKDYPLDIKRIRLDHDNDMATELLESKILSTTDEDKPMLSTYTRQKLESRKRDDNVVIPKNKLLRQRYQNLRSCAENLYMKGVRPQWHPSEPATILKQSDFICFVTEEVVAVPLLLTYFEKYLEPEGRLDELPKILQSSVLNFSPFLIELIDSHVLDLKRDRSIKKEKADGEIKSICEEILLSPTTSKYSIEQRRRLGEWIKRKLTPSLGIILTNISDDEDNLATHIIYECLVHGNVKEAAKQAIQFKYYNLALFISLYSCSNSEECKNAFAVQYSESTRIFRNCHKDRYMMSIYQMFGEPNSLKDSLNDNTQ